MVSPQTALSKDELEHLFLRYAVPKDNKTPGSPPQTSLDLAMQSVAISDKLPPTPPATSASLPPPSSSPPAPPTPAPVPSASPPLTVETATMSLSSFTAFLLSPDNSAFADQHGRITHDMTRPLPEYLISASHNTYLVGHQLVGESTVEGYIRALLHSCRSVELDIFDGEGEPVVYHGRTLTSKVLVRDICHAIMKYAFVTSPYPIIISAEIHCGVAQQAQLVSIMKEAFGDALVWAPVGNRPKIEVLPSPEELKGRVMLKTKNLYIVAEKAGVAVADTDTTGAAAAVDSETTSTESSASDSDIGQEIRHGIRHEWRRAREGETEIIKGAFVRRASCRPSVC